MRLLDAARWRALAAEHGQRADRHGQPFVDRRSRGEKHPVEDFLFTYYTLSPGQLRRWHPGAGVILLDAAERRAWKHYRPAVENELRAAGLETDAARDIAAAGTAVTVDVEGFLSQRQRTVEFVRDLLSRTLAKPGSFGCFGLHEWAMAYRSEVNGHRHEYLDLRLGAAGTDEVVEGHRITCTHFDAFRFFQPQAVPLNTIQPSRRTQREMEQPGCLHANMDVYKWAYKLLPLVDSDLLLEAFELSREIREMDMRAAPYDLADWGYTPIRIETAEGKREYARLQRGFAERSQHLRERLTSLLRTTGDPSHIGTAHVPE
ncbi:3-methyladenine DNA glycosylase [Rothia kristinae]|uniref:3-methyladenine DNA glycosylase n=1 Tax=Rothia kristinae TaxID=37923 RepID=UPI00341D90C6